MKSLKILKIIVILTIITIVVFLSIEYNNFYSENFKSTAPSQISLCQEINTILDNDTNSSKYIIDEFLDYYNNNNNKCIITGINKIINNNKVIKVDNNNTTITDSLIINKISMSSPGVTSIILYFFNNKITNPLYFLFEYNKPKTLNQSDILTHMQISMQNTDDIYDQIKNVCIEEAPTNKFYNYEIKNGDADDVSISLENIFTSKLNINTPDPFNENNIVIYISGITDQTKSIKVYYGDINKMLNQPSRSPTTTPKSNQSKK